MLFIWLLLFFTCDDFDGPDPSMIWDFVNYSISCIVANTELLNDKNLIKQWR